ncbi:uncharacterized protein LOC126633865 [Malus sylvestris]|uniref:uncharacterized protein LOC126633865 n=1 Tax=Malus sylvestris TaxID=3752 RepID=UPI0021AD183C|nr:uncharacterized protein LOC126633865 [Malus sylvestris]
MESKKAQVVLAADARNKSVITARGVTSGIITRCKAKALSAASSAPASTPPKAQGHSRHEPVITLASLRAPREESQRKYSESLLSDADSSSGIAMQVMVTGATSIEEQLAQMNEAIAKLTRTVEDKDLQIAALVNQLDAKPDEKVRQGDNPVKNDNDEDEEPPMKNVEEKPKPDQRLNMPTSQDSAFERLSKPKKQSNTISSPPRRSVLGRLEENRKFSRNKETTSKEEKLDRLAEKAQEDDTEEESQDVFHITIQESKEYEIPEEDVTAAPPQLEDGGQSTVDDLKELNLGSKKEQKPIFVSALLSADEVEEYY